MTLIVNSLPFISVAIVVLAGVILCFALARRERARFEERFPPISDAEFVARCGPGISPRVALGVRRILADTLGVEYERIYPSARWIADLGAE